MPGGVLAVDVGATKLAAAIVDPAGGVRHRRQAPTPSTGDAEVVWTALTEVADAALQRAGSDGPLAVGVGCGGPMGPGGEEVSPLNITAWRSFPLRARLAGRYGLPVHVDNDAKAIALAEGWQGAARGVRDYVALTVSSGVGGGIVLDGRLLEGRLGNAGHVGHLVVVPDGRGHAGVRGTLEGEASGTAIAARLGRPAAEAPVAERRRCGTLVGRAVGGVANLLDLRLAVVGGSVALGFGSDFFVAAQAEVDRVARLDHARGTRVVPTGLGDRAPLVGAAAVAYATTTAWPGPATHRHDPAPEG